MDLDQCVVYSDLIKYSNNELWYFNIPVSDLAIIINK